MKSNFLLILLIVLAGQLQAQIRQGVVLDANTREPIVGASVFIKGATIGTSCNLEGVFDLHGFPKPSYQIHISAIGYETSIFEIPKTSKFDTVTILLNPKTSELAKTTIKGKAIRTGCNRNTPGWGESLGTVSFVTERVFPIANDTLTQIWSDAVTATSCQKETYSGGSLGLHLDYNADCRSNPKHRSDLWPYGDLFSWCAVYRFKEQLCPKPWRVPTKEDFANLDILLGGTGYSTINTNHDVRDKYYSRWGGNYGSICWPTGELGDPGYTGTYWSLSEHDYMYAYFLAFVLRSNVSIPSSLYMPNLRSPKDYGRTLRCVFTGYD